MMQRILTPEELKTFNPADAEMGNDDDRGDRGGGGDRDHRPSQATRLITAATSAAEFWHTPDGDAYATVKTGDHREHWPIRSKSFRRWLQHSHYLGSGGAANAQAVQDAIGTLEGKAIFDGAEFSVFMRVAEHRGRIYHDLADPQWRAIEVDANGWRVVDNPPVRFRRARAMLPLPAPTPGGHVDTLRQYINVADADWPLILAWLLAAMFPRGPYPVLVFAAEQGSGKSTASRVLRSFIDPNTAPLRSEPREPRDLMISATNGWVIALDNLSRLPDWLSDVLCRLSTGGGFSTRTLYENDGETIFEAQRPVVVNGIEDVIDRGDLVDRSLMIGLPTIPEHQRRTESSFWTDFNLDRPLIYGAMLSALSIAISNRPKLKLSKLPRMADFALLATAAEPGLGLRRGSFIEAYTGNRSDANLLAIDGSMISKFILEVAAWRSDKGDTWNGTAAELMIKINNLAGESLVKQKEWPKTPKAVAGAVKRLAPNLRRAGIVVDDWREPGGNRRRMLAIRTEGDFSVPIVPNPENNVESRDAAGRNIDFRDTSGTQKMAEGDARDAPDAEKHPYSDDGDEVLEWSA